VTTRSLTSGEIELAKTVFGDAINYPPVRVHHRRWFPFQPKDVIMAPDGDIWINPKGSLWREDYSKERLGLQGLFLHELTHVWQAQTRGRWYLVLMRHPFCRYAYRYQPGWPLERYGLEQQAEIIRHVFLLRHGQTIGDTPLQALEATLPFTGVRSGERARHA
jgi:hypothetical protein